MNRRSFITTALAGLAAVPLIGKLAQAEPQLPPVYKGPIEYGEVKYVLGSFALGPIDRVESVFIDGVKVYDARFYSTVYPTNPKTRKPWTEADLNGF